MPQGVGAWPFVLKAAERGVAIELEAHPAYFKPGLPKLRGVRLVAYGDETLRAAALQAGDLDMIEYVPWQSMATIEADPALVLQTTEGPFMFLESNGKSGPFADKRVRQAVAHAIKRDEVVKAAFFGRGSPLEGMPVVRSSPFFDATLARGQAYDPARAKQLLAEAGLPNGFSTSLLATSTYGMHKDTAEVIQQNLTVVGIQVSCACPTGRRGVGARLPGGGGDHPGHLRAVRGAELAGGPRLRRTGPRGPARMTRLLLPGAAVAVIVLIAALAPVLPLVDPVGMDVAHRLSAPGAAHVLGQDEYGRDVLSRLVWGARTSLAVALSASAIAWVADLT